MQPRDDTRFIPTILFRRNHFDLLIAINIAGEEKLLDKWGRKKKRGKTMGSKRALKKKSAKVGVVEDV